MQDKPIFPGKNKQIQKIDTATNWLLVMLVAIPFLISFGSLKALAADNHVSYPFAYPFMVDGGLLVFKALALRSALRGQRDWYAWSMAVILTITSVALNILHVPTSSTENLMLARFMAALPPLVILSAFIAVSRRIEENARHETAVLTHETLTKSITDKQQELSHLDIEFDKIRAEKLAEIEAIATQRQAEIDSDITQRQQQVVKLDDKIEQLRDRQQQLQVIKNEAAKRGNGRVNSAKTTAFVNSNDGHGELTERQVQILTLMKDGVDKADIGDVIGVSSRTVYRDITSMNGVVANLEVA